MLKMIYAYHIIECQINLSMSCMCVKDYYQVHKCIQYKMNAKKQRSIRIAKSEARNFGALMSNNYLYCFNLSNITSIAVVRQIFNSNQRE